jgi:metallo-beta-lactamase class B
METMSSHVGGVCAAVALAGALGAAAVQAQQPRAARDFDAEIRAALQSAKDAAGVDFLGALARTCLLPQSVGENNTDTLPGYVTKSARAPARDTWYAEPARVFDNLYFVGGKVHSSWALTTSEGIIIIDTIYPYNSEELIVGGLQKLGLDPKTIKYGLISHAHGDHIGGSTVTIWLTPGHTPGTLSYTFQVLDRGRPVNVAYSGGTAFNFGNNTPNPGIRNFQTLQGCARAAQLALGKQQAGR